MKLFFELQELQILIFFISFLIKQKYEIVVLDFCNYLMVEILS